MENKDIEIIEEEKEGISIGDICKKIWHAKITLGVTFVIATVVCVLAWLSDFLIFLKLFTTYFLR